MRRARLLLAALVAVVALVGTAESQASAQYTPGPERYVVQEDDDRGIWGILEARGMPAELLPFQVRMVHVVNRDVIGPDPGLLYPGQEILLPGANAYRSTPS